MKNIKKIVITGCSNSERTQSIQAIAEYFTEKKFRVIIVDEIQEELTKLGIINTNNAVYQSFYIKELQFKESMAKAAAITFDEDNILIICNKGLMDCAAAMNEQEFLSVCKGLKTNIVELRDDYDAVFHMTAMEKSASFTDCFGNVIPMYEQDRESVYDDDRTLSCWTGHKHLRLITPSQNTETRNQKLIREIEAIFIDIEIERAYLTERPTDKLLNVLPFCHAVDIEQCYIKTNKQQFRIRKRGESGFYKYYITQKSDISSIRRSEYEQEITADDYELYKQSAYSKLSKTRYYLCVNDKYFELDIYPFSDIYARLEIELISEEDEFDRPPFLICHKEVTGEYEYSNKHIAETKQLTL